MNVKPGDLARIVGNPDAAAAVVHVIALLPHDTPPTVYQPAWRCKALCSIPLPDGSMAPPGSLLAASDRSLRRLGDSGVEDELVRFAAKEQQA